MSDAAARIAGGCTIHFQNCDGTLKGVELIDG
jgi:hypothetical protein